jgi:hypothetical protein
MLATLWRRPVACDVEIPSRSLVGRTPWSAAGPPAGFLLRSTSPPLRYNRVRPFAVLFGALFEDFLVFLAADPDDRRGAGNLPIRGSMAMMSSQARRAASAKSGASAGRTCQPVTSLPSIRMDRMFGNSRRRLSWCSLVVASQTPLSALASTLSRSMRTILSST